MELMDIQHRILLSSLWTSSTCRLGDLLHASYGRLAAGKGRHTYIPIKMASGVQDITCVFVEVAGSYEDTLILQCPGMVCSPPVVSKCLGEAHRRQEVTLHYITLHYITLILPPPPPILLVIC